MRHALWKLYCHFTVSCVEFVGFSKVSCDMYHTYERGPQYMLLYTVECCVCVVG